MILPALKRRPRWLRLPERPSLRRPLPWLILLALVTIVAGVSFVARIALELAWPDGPRLGGNVGDGNAADYSQWPFGIFLAPINPDFIEAAESDSQTPTTGSVAGTAVPTVLIEAATPTPTPPIVTAEPSLTASIVSAPAVEVTPTSTPTQTATPTRTPVPRQAPTVAQPARTVVVTTPTPAQPSATPATNPGEPTRVPTNTPTNTSRPTNTPTNTPRPTSPPTRTPTNTPTNTPTRTSTPGPSPTPSPTLTPTPPSVGFVDSTIVAPESQGSVTLRVRLANAYHLPVTVSYSVDMAGSTATRDSDYSVADGTFTFAPGDTEKQIVVTLLNDRLDEENERVTMRLISFNNAVNAGTDTTVLTIVDSNIAPTVRFTRSAQTVGESIGATTFTAELNEVSGLSVAVPYTVGGTASYGTSSQGPGDHTLRSGVLVIPKGAKSVRVPVGIVDDRVDEDNEQIVITMGTPLNADPVGPLVHTITIVDDDTAGVVVSPLVLALNEAPTAANHTATYTVALTSQPTAPVTITVRPDAQASVNPATLVFNATNWRGPLTVTVTAVDDNIDEPNPHSGVVTHTVASADPFYAGLPAAQRPRDVGLTIADNDTAGIIVSRDTIALSESPTAITHTTTYTVFLTSQPTAPVTVTALPDAQATVSPAALVFNATNWRGPLTVTVTAVDDDYDEPTPHAGLITHTVASADPFYAILAGSQPGDVALAISDNDSVGIAVTAGTLALREGLPGPNSGTYTVTLTSRPTAPVTVTLTITDPAQLSLAPTQLVFGADPLSWKTPRNVSVTATQDLIDEGPDGVPHTRAISHSAASGDGGYNGLGGPQKLVAITDDDTAGIVLGAGAIAVAEGGTITYSVRLNSQPTAPVTLALAANPTGAISVAPASLTFTAANWQNPVDVTVDAADNFRVDGARPVTITHSVSASGDTIYGALGPVQRGVTVLDNDVAGLRLSDSGPLTITEGLRLTYGLALTAEPTQTVTVTLALPPALEADQAVVVFTPGTWTITQTVTLTATDDAIFRGVQSGVVGHTLTSAEPAFNLSGPGLSVTVLDNDNAGLATTPATLAISETTGFDQGTFSVALTSEPTATVTVTLAHDAAQLGVSPAQLVFTPATYSQTQVVTVTAVDDAIAETTPHSSTITLASSSADPFYNAAWPDVGVAIDDNDTAAIGVLAPASLLTSEDGLTTTLQIWLTSQPTAPVTISVGTDDPTEAGVSVAAPQTLPLVFDQSNWMTPTTVIITGLDDSEADGLQPYTVLISDAVSADPFYSGLAPAITAIGMGNLDNEPALAAISDAIAVQEGNSGTSEVSFPLTLTRAPLVTVTVGYETYDLSALAGEDYLAATGVVTFTPGMTTSAISVTVYGDTVYEQDELIGVRLTTATAVGDVTGLQDSTASARIINDEPAGLHFELAETVVSEGSGVATMTVRLDEAQGGDISVDYRRIAGTGGGSATDGADFSGASGTLTFTAGQTTQTLSVPLIDDTVIEDLYETLNLELFNTSVPTLTITSPSTATLMIVDNDQPLPPAAELFLLSGGPATNAADGYYYTGQTSGYSYLIFSVPCSWPPARPLSFELWSAAMHAGPSQDKRGADGLAGSSEFELYDLGLASAGASLTPAQGTGIATATFPPVAVAETWEVLQTISTPTPCGRYALRAAAAGDDENYWAARAGFATDADPATPLDAYAPGSPEHVTTAALHTTTEHQNSNTATTLWFYVAPGTGTLLLRNFDLDYGPGGSPRDPSASVRYYEPGTSYDPSGANGGIAGTPSGSGTALASSWSEDVVSKPGPGWWRAVVSTGNAENAYIIEAIADGASLPLRYDAPAGPELDLGLEASQATAAPGDRLSLTLVYTNSGAVSAAGPMLTLRLPGELAFDGDACGVTTGCSWGADGTLTLIQSWLAPGMTGSLTVNVVVRTGTSGAAAVGLGARFADMDGYPGQAGAAAIVTIP